MTQRRDISDDEVIEGLEEFGRSWRDYFLVGDPPLVCSGGKHGLNGMIIDDDDVASATKSFLIARGVRWFRDVEEFKAATGWDGLWRPEGSE